MTASPAPHSSGAIRLIVLDVDGTLTDGVIHYDSDGAEHKHFHVTDGLGIVMARAVGLQIAVLSGRRSPVVERRMAELGVGDIIQASGDKAAALRELAARQGVSLRETAYVGDDVNDLPAFDVAGLKIAVADAAEIVRAQADYVTPRPGGRGGVRDAIDEILRRAGRYDEAVAAYLARSVAPDVPRQ
ncbi:MAG: HAD-IIIA family hydrolase [Armatimonadetes bacterium]|nr:HAD-IIIA family hydrolase [Armatimonadota bacterium]